MAGDRDKPAKGKVPPALAAHSTGDLLLARLEKARATRLRKLQTKREEAAALRNAGLLEARLRKSVGGTDVKVLGSLMLDQMRRTAITAIELADIRAREQGHQHGLADLMAGDLMRKPTETLVAWSKFLPMGGATVESNTEMHLEAVRALTLATSAATQAVRVAADLAAKQTAPEIHGNAVDIVEGPAPGADCDRRCDIHNNGGDRGVIGGGANAASGEGGRGAALAVPDREQQGGSNSATTGPLATETHKNINELG